MFEAAEASQSQGCLRAGETANDFWLKLCGVEFVAQDESVLLGNLPHVNLLHQSFTGVLLVAVRKRDLAEIGFDPAVGRVPGAPKDEDVAQFAECESQIQALIDESYWHALAARCEHTDAEVSVQFLFKFLFKFFFHFQHFNFDILISNIKIQ